jgi:hypothetical protein
VLTAEDLKNVPKFLRYTNEDENFVAARTLPGVSSKGSYFVRGSGHNKFGGYTEIPDEYQEVMDRLKQKHAASAKFVPEPEIHRREGAKFGIIAMGGCDPAVREAVDQLDRQGTPADYMRVRGFPFQRSGPDISGRTRVLLRGGTESRCAASCAADAGDQRAEREVEECFGLRRISLEQSPRSARDLEPILGLLGEYDHAVDSETQRHASDFATQRAGPDHRDYEGTMSTLCAGCGHDSITAPSHARCGNSRHRPIASPS